MTNMRSKEHVLRVLLASRSPARWRILEEIGLEFDAIAMDVDEDGGPELTPQELVARHATLKADAALERHPDYDLVIAADTVVECDGAILGSPRTDDEARAMLQKISGRTHTIVTGLVVVRSQGARVCRLVESTVTVRALDAATIEDYVRTGEPLHKAGAYGIQGLGSLFIERVEGSHTNVRGLPIEALAEALAELGFDLLALIGPGRLKSHRP